MVGRSWQRPGVSIERGLKAPAFALTLPLLRAACPRTAHHTHLPHTALFPLRLVLARARVMDAYPLPLPRCGVRYRPSSPTTLPRATTALPCNTSRLAARTTRAKTFVGLPHAAILRTSLCVLLSDTRKRVLFSADWSACFPRAGATLCFYKPPSSRGPGRLYKRVRHARGREPQTPLGRFIKAAHCGCWTHRLTTTTPTRRSSRTCRLRGT